MMSFSTGDKRMTDAQVTNGADLIDLRLPRLVVDQMMARSYSPWDRVIDWCDALRDHNPELEPIKPGDWAKPDWDSMGPCLVVAVGLEGGDTIMALRHCHRGETDSVRWAIGVDWKRCGPHPDPEVRARIEKAAGR